MSQRSSTPAGPGGASGPVQPEPDAWEDDDEWPDDLWPDDDETPEDAAAGDAAAGAAAGSSFRGEGPAWPAPPWPSMPPPPPPGRRVPPVALVAIALMAAGIGAVIVLAVGGLSGSPATPASQPTVQGPAQPGAGGGAFPGSGTSEMLIGGRVSAVSATSITIGVPGRTMTAAVTSSTRFTGQVSSISGVKVGDQVTAQLTQNGGSVTAVSISDPAQIPSGGGAP